ncbi:hypothetical protein GCM10022420_086480 [Streptomyces iranensis]
MHRTPEAHPADPIETDEAWMLPLPLVGPLGWWRTTQRLPRDHIIDADTRMVVATARPAPGNKADAHVWRNSGLPDQCRGVTVLGDGTYIKTGLVVPHSRGRALTCKITAFCNTLYSKGGPVTSGHE